MNYTVKQGDTVSGILKAQGNPNWANPSEWTKLGIANPNQIRTGQVLNIPPQGVQNQPIRSNEGAQYGSPQINYNTPSLKIQAPPQPGFQPGARYGQNPVSLMPQVPPALPLDNQRGQVLSANTSLRGGNSPTPGQLNHTLASVNSNETPPGVGNTDLWNQVVKGAQAAQQKYGVPASVTLAQFFLETGGGKHMVGNNLFGIKGSGSNGSAKALTWEQGPNGPYQTYSNFRTYKNVQDSIDDHARLLAESPAYHKFQGLIAEASPNPDKYAEALQGIYATDPAYADKLKSLLRRHNLVQYDTDGGGGGGGGGGGSVQADQFNIPAQVGAVAGMNPQQAELYRYQVDQTMPQISTGNIPVVSGLASGIANAIPNAAAGLARLPAARDPQEAGWDIFNFLGGALGGASGLNAGRAGLGALARNPSINNQTGGLQWQWGQNPSVPTDSQMASIFNSPEIQNAMYKFNNMASPAAKQALNKSLPQAMESGDYRGVLSLLANYSDATTQGAINRLMQTADAVGGARVPGSGPGAMLAKGVTIPSDNGATFNSAIDSMTSRPLGGPGMFPAAFDRFMKSNTSPEVINNNATGWSNPQVKSAFDFAMLQGDKNALLQLLPQVPKDYANKFAQQISQVLQR